jgi:acylglycerol lipase
LANYYTWDVVSLDLFLCCHSVDIENPRHHHHSRQHKTTGKASPELCQQHLKRQLNIMKVTLYEYNLWGQKVHLPIAKRLFPTDDELAEMESHMEGCQHGFIESTFEKSKLHYRKFLPKDKPKGIAVFMHGISAQSGHSHIIDGRKLNMSLMAEEFNKRGIAVYALDMLGHGYSEGHRFFVPTWQTNRDDLDAFARLAASEHDEGLPLFLTGESYGGCLCLHLARKWEESDDAPKGFSGTALMAPAIIGDLPPAPVVFVLRYLLAPFFPKWIPFFMPNPISSDRIWRDPKVLAKNIDPRYKEMGIDGSGNPFCLGTAVQLLSALEAVRSVTIPNLTSSFCVVHGTKDYGVPISGTDFLEANAKTPKKDQFVMRQEGAYHDLLGDPVAESTVSFMLDYIEGQMN